MTLYEIDSRLAEMLEAVDPDTGELLIDEAEIEALQMARDEKLENIALAIKNISAEAEAIGNEVKNLVSRKKTAENKVERLKGYLAGALAGEKLKTAKVSVSYTHSKAVVVEAGFVEWAQENNDSFLKYSEPTVDKKALSNALKSGEEIPFVKFEERSNIQVK